MEFASIADTIYTMFTTSIGGYDPNAYQDANLEIAALIGFIAFIIMSTIMMLNIFIAMINNTYQKNIASRQAQITYAVSLLFNLLFLASL